MEESFHDMFLRSRASLDVCSAKNVILAGVKAVTLHDTTTVQQHHLSAQFFLSEADVGRNRAEACAAKLQELNTAVAVSVVTTEITEEHLAKFQVRIRQQGLVV